MKIVELFRHTDNDDDELTAEGVRAAEEIGRTQLSPPYDAFVSSGAARATRMLQILGRSAGQDDMPVIEEPGLRSVVEDRWRDAAKSAGKGADLEAIRDQDADLVERESLVLGLALGRVFDALTTGGRALVVGHSPTNEAAVLGLVGSVVPPLGKGEGVRITETDGSYAVEPIA